LPPGDRGLHCGPDGRNELLPVPLQWRKRLPGQAAPDF